VGTNLDIGVAVARTVRVARIFADPDVGVVVARVGCITGVSDNGDIMIVIAISNAVASPLIPFSIPSGNRGSKDRGHQSKKEKGDQFHDERWCVVLVNEGVGFDLRTSDGWFEGGSEEYEDRYVVGGLTLPEACICSFLFPSPTPRFDKDGKYFGKSSVAVAASLIGPIGFRCYIKSRLETRVDSVGTGESNKMVKQKQNS
jgi:hypothetical protein